ncbi:VWA domain-containing protein, partial [Escherichia coli]|nr:VWA domain-containing protein [Escherichia coli]
QFGVLQEAVPVKKVTDLTKLNAAIDKFLQPVGLTGFKQPLEEAAQVIKRIKQNDATGVFSLFFMTDGYDNEWKTQEILNVVAPLQKELASATFIEYGWNCNRKLLSQMAETVGG